MAGVRAPAAAARLARAALDLDAAYNGEAANHDAGRARDDRDVAHAPAHEGEPAQLDVEALGQDDLDAPQKATAVISTSGPSISARRTSMSQPPITASAVVLPLIRQRPRV
jgi:hypothetical protein